MLPTIEVNAKEIAAAAAKRQARRLNPATERLIVTSAGSQLKDM